MKNPPSNGVGAVTSAKRSFQRAKAVARNFQSHFCPDNSGNSGAKDFIGFVVRPDVKYYGVAPFDDKSIGLEGIALFYDSLGNSFRNMQRREDVFIAGANEARKCVGREGTTHEKNDVTAETNVWVCSMGHYMGQFDRPFLNIPATGKLCCVRYCEFYRVADRQGEAGAITALCTHIDILSIMAQASVYPLPQPTGAHLPYVPGPATRDGVISADGSLQVEDHDTEKTSELLAAVIGVHSGFNQIAKESGGRVQGCTPGAMRPHWHDDMLWYGPHGIGSTGLSIERYQRQHQLPFRENLYDKRFHGHVARIAEGRYEAWFGWPNLTNKSSGGFMGLPGSDTAAEMRVAVVYRRDGDKLAENWVFIDMIHYLKMRGPDVLGRREEVCHLYCSIRQQKNDLNFPIDEPTHSKHIEEGRCRMR